MIEVDGLERVARQVGVAWQRLEVEPVDLERVQGVAGGGQRLGSDFVDGAKAADLNHQPKIFKNVMKWQLKPDANN